MRPVGNYVGKTYGRLTVLEDLYPGIDRFRVRCTCGTEKIVWRGHTLLGRIKSCGAWACRPPARKTHGLTGTPVYLVWSNMRARCKHPYMTSYKDYGGRGIKVCERWQKFDNFIADMGMPPPGHEIDRIDTNGNYEPSNCRWVPAAFQAANKRTSVRFVLDGKTYTNAELRAKWGMSRMGVEKRALRMGAIKRRLYDAA